MNDLTPIRPDLAEPIAVGNRHALLLPDAFDLSPEQMWVIHRHADGFRLIPYVEADWRWANGLTGTMDDDWARAVEEGRIAADHPDNALDDDPVFD